MTWAASIARVTLDCLLAWRGFGLCAAGALIGLFSLSFQPGVFANLGPNWFDALNQVWPRQRISEPVVIVAIDEASVAEFGTWPWPRAQTARLFERIAAAGPAAVGVDIIFSEAASGSAAAIALQPDVPLDVKAWLEAQPSGDDALAAAIATGPFVLAVGDRGAKVTGPPDGMPPGILYQGPDPAPALTRWQVPFTPLRSLANFTDAASGEGVIIQDPGVDGVVRQIGQIFQVGGGHLAPGLALEMMRVASGANRIGLVTDARGVDLVVLVAGNDPVLTLQTEPDGTVRPWLGARDVSREVSALGLLNDDAELARLTGKLVLVGYTAAGGVDKRVSALGELLPGVDMHRQTLEAIFDQRLLHRPTWALRAETLFAIVLILAAAFLPIRFRIGPGMLVGAAVILAPLAISATAYRANLLLLDGATPALAAFVGSLTGLMAHLILTERDRRRAQAVQARFDGEMAAAKRIQMGILPNAAELFAGESRFSIAATSEPARTVGGDLFDFFLLDDRRLFFLVGDVAGKGPEASLFMAISKSLCKSTALRGGMDIGQILTQANTEIARDNPATMFVTAFAGILDVESGVLDYCCAGHEPPWRVPPDGPAVRLEGVGGGPPLCLLDEFDYETDRTTLAPGEMVVVVTDGVTEAANRAGELFGVERTDAVIADMPGAPDAAAALDLLTRPVHDFADGEEPADDLTALVVIWRG